jgi:threonylcarbamoyladenosine tRNA methylthiotransferase MtaB
MLTYRITTLGCRVNHAETRDMESVLISRGFERAPNGRSADLEIVHTCSVTNTAAAKSRQAVRRAIRRLGRDHDLFGPGRPHAFDHADASNTADAPPRILVTGCYAATDGEEAATIAGAASNVLPQQSDDGSAMIDRFAARVDAWLTRHSAPQIRSAATSSSRTAILPLPVVPPVPNAGGHIRAELRIQDGCDAHCTFCIIPRIRRTLRSKTIPAAVDEARRLVDLGHREIVLTGIFIGAYGHETALRRKQERAEAEPLADLLDAVAQTPGLERLRISSMEPGDVTAPLLDAMVANEPVVVPHLHLPLQSGSDHVLRSMNRQYRVGDYLDMIDMANDALTRDGLAPAITTDIICGFPGESESDFDQTLDVAERVGFLHMHVFPFSPKQGTAAARWGDRAVSASIKRRRVRALIDLERDPERGCSIRFRRRLVGRTVRVILEQVDRAQPEYVTGRCDHYALVHLPRDDRFRRGRVVEVIVAEVDGDRTVGTLVDARLSLPLLQASAT